MANSGSGTNTNIALVRSQVHGTCVSLAGRGALLFGPPGAGKSDLALRFIFTPLPESFGQPMLVADDQVEIAREEGKLIARCPARIEGRIEVRGVGIAALPFASQTELRLAVKLTDRESVPRLPDGSETHDIAGIPLPCLALYPFEPSAPLKLALALHRIEQFEGN